MKQKSMATELAGFIPRYVYWTFLNYMFNQGGGTSGSLKVLFPAEPGDKDASNDRASKTPLMYPYYPKKAGWVTPQDSDEFQTMISVPADRFAPHKQVHLRQAWASKGFNQSSLCLLDNNAMTELLEEYVKGVDWRQLVQQVRQHPAWLEHIEATNKTLKKAYIQKYTEFNSRPGMFRFQKDESMECTSDDGDIDVSGVGLVDDIIDQQDTSAMES